MSDSLHAGADGASAEGLSGTPLRGQLPNHRWGVGAVWNADDCVPEQPDGFLFPLPSRFRKGNFPPLIKLLASLSPSKQSGIEFRMKGRNGETVGGRHAVRRRRDFRSAAARVEHHDEQ